MTEPVAVEFFCREIPWGPPDESPTVPFPSFIAMEELPQPKSCILADGDKYEDTPQSANPELGLTVRYPHLMFDALGSFPDLKTGTPEEVTSAVMKLSNDYLDRWVKKDNIEEALITPPAVEKKKGEFIAIGINQIFAAALMFTGKANKPASYTLWVYVFSETCWRKTAMTFPSHSGVLVEDGGLHLLILCKETLRCIDCVSEGGPFLRWQTEPMPMKLQGSADYQCGIASAFGTVFLETADNQVHIFNLKDGKRTQTVDPPLLAISIGCSQQTFVVGSNAGDVAIYGREKDSDQFRLLNKMKYSGELKTRAGKTLSMPLKPVLHLINQNTKVCFAMGQAIVMEERHPTMQRIRILESLSAVTLALVTDHMVVMGPDGTLRMGYFAECKAFFEKKYPMGTAVWRHNQVYLSGTFAVRNLIFPDGRLLFLRPKKEVPPPPVAVEVPAAIIVSPVEEAEHPEAPIIEAPAVPLCDEIKE
jgi:hypothetical protein